MIIAGIDEAGRGPAIGPLVMAIALIDESKVDELAKIGVKDSKLLTPLQRERMFEEIQKICQFEIVSVTPAEIDEAVESETTNLNWLEADTAIKMLNMHKPKKAFIDCPSANPKAYTKYLQEKLNAKMDLVVEHKADANYLIVGAASILAKVTRDQAIQDLQKKHNVRFGSGYPSDPVTSAFIRENWNRFDFFRKSWGTWKAAANKTKQKKLEF
jgi:ribonuclease HII